jgi:hypothetical protein
MVCRERYVAVCDDGLDRRQPPGLCRGDEPVETPEADAASENAHAQHGGFHAHGGDLGAKAQPTEIDTDPPRDQITMTDRPQRHILEDEMTDVRFGDGIGGVDALVGKINTDRRLGQRPARRPGESYHRSQDSDAKRQPVTEAHR